MGIEKITNKLIGLFQTVKGIEVKPDPGHDPVVKTCSLSKRVPKFSVSGPIPYRANGFPVQIAEYLSGKRACRAGIGRSEKNAGRDGTVCSHKKTVQGIFRTHRNLFRFHCRKLQVKPMKNSLQFCLADTSLPVSVPQGETLQRLLNIVEGVGQMYAGQQGNILLRAPGNGSWQFSDAGRRKQIAYCQDWSGAPRLFFTFVEPVNRVFQLFPGAWSPKRILGAAGETGHGKR